MAHEDCDFSGYVTKANTRCRDGRIIDPNAFSSHDGQSVALMWDHQHQDPTNILGKVFLEHRDDGMYGYGYFNDTEMGQEVKKMLIHGDITSLSIWANHLKQSGPLVKDGTIREVSLCLAGANPDAWIDYVAHSDDADYDDEMFVYIGDKECELQHSATNDEENTLAHADDVNGKGPEKKVAENKEKTVGDVLDELTEEQRAVVDYLVEAAANSALAQAASEEDTMKHNAFDNNDGTNDVLAHSEFAAAVIEDGKRYGSMKESFIAHSEEYGIEQIDWLQPDFKDVNGGEIPFIKNEPSGWTKIVTAGVHHTPFSKIKMLFADIREDSARAKGYSKKGKYKQEQVISLLKRQVTPTTVYKKQKFDRDDLVDIDDMTKVSWIKAEMRMQLDEELARAYIFGDGRSVVDDDKISESNIIPVVSDQPLFTIQKTVTVPDGASLAEAIIDASVEAQDDYEGSGNITMFMDATKVTACLLLKDTNKHRLYKDIKELATAMNVDTICKVPANIFPDGVYAVALDLNDYNVGADKGGAINMFDDFDIDYNQYKYLIETRCSAALTKPFSAYVLKEA